MNNNEKIAFKIYFTFVIMMICSVIGVGFVSGAEIYRFFVKYEKYAYFGVIVFFALIYFLTLKILKSCIISQNDLIALNLQNQKCVKMKNLNNFLPKSAFLCKFKLKSILTGFNVFMLASAMFAGLFVVLKNLFNHNYFLIGIFCLLSLFLLVLFGVSTLQKFDYFVAVLIGFVAVYFIFSKNNSVGFELNKTYVFEENDFGFSLKNFWLASLFSCIYVFMNIIQIQPIVQQFASEFEGKPETAVFAKTKPETLVLAKPEMVVSGKTKPAVSAKTCKKIAFWFALSLSLLLFVFVKFLLKNAYLTASEMPFLKFFKNQGGAVFVLFVLGLMLSLISSLSTALIGVKEQIKHFTKSNFFATAVALILVGLASLIGFSNLVFYVYPIIGILNLIIYVFL